MRPSLPISPACDLQSAAFEDRYLLSVELAHRRQWLDAAELLKQLVRERPGLQALARVGCLPFGSQRVWRGGRLLFHGHRLAPGTVLGLLLPLGLPVNRNEYGAAIEDCNEVISRKSDLPAAYINRALAVYAAGKTKACSGGFGYGSGAGNGRDPRLFSTREMEAGAGKYGRCGGGPGGGIKPDASR